MFIGGPLAFGGPGAGSPLRWFWIAIPAAIFLAGVALAWRAFTDATPGASWVQLLSDASTAVLGVSPRTHRRG